MAFSIAGRCPDTGQLGIAISASTIAVGARCLWLRAGVGAVVTQHASLPALGTQILNLLSASTLPSKAMADVLETNGWSQYRQIIVIDAQGSTAMFSGDQVQGQHGVLRGVQCVVAGNRLVQTSVLSTMIQAFENTPGVLGDRLLAALDAARRAGGEVGAERSAALKIVSAHCAPLLDLRVDWAEEPFAALYRLWQTIDEHKSIC